MSDLVEYRTILSDSTRWQRFEHRPGDIVICTPPKSGTTWTQMLCALLVFDGPDFPAPIDAMSPWLDMTTRSEAEVFAQLDALGHRRFIKTHTPLDGIPIHDEVTYVVVGRDPRDVLVSWEHHMANIRMDTLIGRRIEAVGAEGLESLGDRAAAEAGRSDDPAERFAEWVDAPADAVGGASLGAVVHHLRDAWRRRDDPAVHLVHFLDLQRDLPGELYRLAVACGLDTSPERCVELAPEAGIGRMRDRADEVTPDITASDHWHDRRRFFRTGESGQWRDRADDAVLDRYHRRLAEWASGDDAFVEWVHGGRLGDGAE